MKKYKNIEVQKNNMPLGNEKILLSFLCSDMQTPCIIEHLKLILKLIKKNKITIFHVKYLSDRHKITGAIPCCAIGALKPPQNFPQEIKSLKK